jgi:hypothetical protein
MKTNSHVFTALALLVLVFSLFPASSAQAGSLVSSSLLGTPPFSGTIFIDPDIITASDPTTFLNAVYTGQGLRTMFDRRVNAFIPLNAYLFNASFSDGLAAEIQVNPEFGSSAAALVEAQKYGPVIGRRASTESAPPGCTNRLDPQRHGAVRRWEQQPVDPYRSG